MRNLVAAVNELVVEKEGQSKAYEELDDALTLAEMLLAVETIEPREGIVMVYDWEGKYLGCMGITTWQSLLESEKK